MNEMAELEKASEIADARLGVAEDFSWYVSILLACLVLQQWDSWLLAVVSWVIGYFVCVYQYRKKSDVAEDAYMKASKTGRYCEEPKKTDQQL
jgi:hypothetical protein